MISAAGRKASAPAAMRRSIVTRPARAAPASSPSGAAGSSSGGASTVIVAGLYERLRLAAVASSPANEAAYRQLNDVRFGEDVAVFSFTNLYGCTIGDRTRIGAFVEIQAGAVIGADCKVQSHTFVCDGVRI